MRIRYRLYGSYLLVSFILLSVLGWMLYDTLTDEVQAGIEERVATGLRIVAHGLEAGTAPAGPGALEAWVDRAALAADARLTIVGPDGRVLADSEFDGPALAALDDHGSRAEVREARSAGEGMSRRYSRSIGADLLYRARRIDRGPWEGSVARIAIPLRRIDLAQDAARREILAALALAMVLALAAGAFWARRLSDPIGELSRMADRVRRGDLEARARVDTGDELEDLARSLEAAQDELGNRIAQATSERDRLDRVLNGMTEGVMVTDAAGRVVLANGALRRIFALERQRTLQGRTVIEALRRRPEIAELLEDAARTGGEVSIEIGLSWPANKVLTLHATGLPSGGAVGVFHDITALKHVDTVRRDFVANVSHELRTPLATIGGYAESIASSPSEAAEVAESAEVIRRNVRRLSALIADLLELSRIEGDGFVPDRGPIDAGELVAELSGEWRPRFEAAGLVFDSDSEPGLVVHADRRLLGQAINNLLENALKYCPAGAEVNLLSERRKDETVFEVIDTGPGIPYPDQARLFERFYRVDRARSRATGGTGLGLAIVKHVAEVHGGTAEVESRPEIGSTFRFTIPDPEERSA